MRKDGIDPMLGTGDSVQVSQVDNRDQRTLVIIVASYLSVYEQGGRNWSQDLILGIVMGNIGIFTGILMASFKLLAPTPMPQSHCLEQASRSPGNQFRPY